MRTNLLSDTERKIALEAIKAQTQQVIDQVRGVAHATENVEDKLAIHGVAETLTTATSQIRHHVDPNWFRHD